MYEQRPTTTILWIKRLIWVYFFLLIFEGVLRKWVLPSLSAPLLVVRDPVVVMIYLLALHARVFPFNRWIIAISVLALFILFTGLYIDQDFPAAALYGFRADFLHLPLVFLIPKVFDIHDVKKLGFWATLLCIPMGLLMAVQFLSPSSAWINAGAGGGGSQIAGGMGHIRPAGTFSFIIGPAFFFPLVTAFLLSTFFTDVRFPRWLVIAAPLALLVGGGVSSSRTLALSIGVVLVCALIAGIVLQPHLISGRLIARTLQGLCVLSVILYIAAQSAVFQEGIQAFSARMDPGVAGAEGLALRAAGDYTDPLSLLSTTPILGHGLGLGTNAGAALTNDGKTGTMLGEAEWTRVVLESGPILGIAYLMLRVILAIWIGGVTARASRQGNTVPFLLFGSCLPVLLEGQFGQPTELGFAVLNSGLAIAAMRISPTYQGRALGTSPPADIRRSEVAA